MSRDYPCDWELEYIRSWDIQKQGVKGLIDFVRETWRNPDWGIEIRRPYKGVITIYLRTGGWSGNEDIVDALLGNFIFWRLCWYRSQRGGHYTFRVPKANWEMGVE